MDRNYCCVPLLFSQFSIWYQSGHQNPHEVRQVVTKLMHRAWKIEVKNLFLLTNCLSVMNKKFIFAFIFNFFDTEFSKIFRRRDASD